MSRRRRLKWNFTAAFVGKVVSVCNQVLLVPLFLYAWGSEYYGIWLLLSAIPSFLSMSNVGVGTAANTEIVLAIGQGNERKANRVLGSAWLFIVVIGCVVATVIMVAHALGFGVDLFGSNQSLVSGHSRIILVLFASVIVMMMRQPLEGFWTARKKASNAMFFGAAASAGELAACAVVLMFSGPAEALAMTILGARTLALIAFFIASRRYVDLRLPLTPDLSLVRSLLGRGMGFQLSVLWQAILFQGSLFLAQGVLGPAGVATWGTIRTLSRSGNQLLALINQAIMPELQNEIAVDNLTDAKRIYHAGIRVAFGAGLAVALPMSVVGGPFYTFWTGGTLSVTPWIWPIMAIGLVLNAVWLTSDLVQQALNRPWYSSSCGLASAIISVAVMYVAGLQFGILGFATGAVVFEALMAFAIPRRSLQLLNQSTTPQNGVVASAA